MARPYRRKDSRFWWIAPWIDGRQVRQSSGETDYGRAERKLRILEGRIAANAPIKPETDRDSFAALLTAVTVDYRIKRRRSLADLERRIELHLGPALGHYRTARISSDVLAAYILDRQTAGASDASINRELAVVKRAFQLGIRSGAVSAIPMIEMLPEENVRQGFYDERQFAAVMAQASPVLGDVLTLGYRSGWRLRSILGLEWRQVDLDEAGLVRLYAAQTKNRRDAVLPLAPFPEVREMLERRRLETVAVERVEGRIIPQVFHRWGEPVRSIRTAWMNCRNRAGLPGRTIHDFRRTAVRNLKRMGFSDTEIMGIVGFKTLSIMLRYNITEEADIVEKGRQIAGRVVRKP